MFDESMKGIDIVEIKDFEEYTDINKIKFDNAQQKAAFLKDYIARMKTARQDWRDKIKDDKSDSKQNLRVKSDYFQDVIDCIRDNEGCSYITYMNDDFKQGDMQEYLSVELSNPIRIDSFGSEIKLSMLMMNTKVPSQILNSFEIPTKYIDVVKKDGYFWSCEIDSLRPNEHLGEMFLAGATLESYMNSYAEKVSRQDVCDFTQDDVAYDYLVRKYIMNQDVVRLSKFSTIINSEKLEVSRAPLEASSEFNLDCLYRKDDEVSSIRDDFQYARENYPNSFRKLCDKMRNFVSTANGKSNLELIFESAFGSNTKNSYLDNYKDYLIDICVNLNLMSDLQDVNLFF